MTLTKSVKFEVKDDQDCNGGFQVHFGPGYVLRITGPNGYAAAEIKVEQIGQLKGILDEILNLDGGRK